MSSTRPRQTAKRGRPFRPYEQPRRTTRQTTAAAAVAATAADSKDEDRCSICLEDITQPKKLGCGHTFCMTCVAEYFRHCCQEKCPTCRKVFGVLRGSQPAGKFTKSVIHTALPGYEKCETIRIVYNIPDGIQTVSVSSLSSATLPVIPVLLLFITRKDRLIYDRLLNIVLNHFYLASPMD